jgi:hypothetical protein
MADELQSGRLLGTVIDYCSSLARGPTTAPAAPGRTRGAAYQQVDAALGGHGGLVDGLAEQQLAGGRLVASRVRG